MKKIYFRLKNFMLFMRDEAEIWCQGRSWLVRLPLLIWFIYVLFKHWDNRSILAPANLGIHELGHFVLSPLGTFIGILGGTLFQLLIPVGLMINFYQQGDFFAIALCFGWLSTNLFDIAAYVADARSMSLPLVSPFGVENVIHDWNYLLGKMGLLQYDATIAFILRCSATISMLICLIAGFWLLWQMSQRR
jgi:hypothetical protein